MSVSETRRTLRYLLTVLVGGLALLLVPGSETARAERPHEYFVYVGTTGKESKGIYVYRFKEDTVRITSLGLAAETPSPFWLVASRDGRYLYVANLIENYQGGDTGSVCAFAINEQTGKLSLLNQVSSRGANPAYVSLDNTGRFLLVANYTSGSVAVFPVNEDGSLGNATAFVQHRDSDADGKPRQPHPHAIEVSPDNRFALVADLGLDKLFVYQFNPTTGALSPATPAYAHVQPGSGPRHFVFSSNGRFIYVEDETASTATVFSYDPASGTLRSLQVISTLPEGFTGNNTGAEIAISHSGKFLYTSNRGNDTIAMFGISPRNATLTPLEQVPTHGKTPGMFAIDPSGRYLFVANERSDNVVVFRINQKTGRLTPTEHVLNVSRPVCVAFVAIP